MTDRPLIPAPEARIRVCRGFDRLAHLIALTLGPTQGVVLSQNGRSPEVLNDAGTIARRVVQLPTRGEDAGAMLLRNLVWTVRERYGDGAATAAVLAQAMVRAALPRIAAGADPMIMRRGMERAVVSACTALEAQAIPACGQELLTRFATGITGDAVLGKLLGEMFDVLGTDAAIQVDEFAAPYLDREYVEGGRWRGRPASRTLMPEGEPALVLRNPLILVSEQRIERAEHVRGALELAAQHPDRPPLLIVAREIGGEALNMLTLNQNRGALTLGAAVITGGASNAQDDVADIALICGAELMDDLRGRPLNHMRAAFFGRAQQTTLTREYLTIVGGKGDDAALRRFISTLQAQASRLNRIDTRWKQLRQRIAKLSGGIGILKVGAYTDRERAFVKEQAEKALVALDAAVAEGVVPGGGAALLTCIPAVRGLEANGDEAHGVAVVASALEAPFRQIVCNHGVVHPPVALAEVLARGDGWGFDAMNGIYANMRHQGVLDSTRVVQGTLTSATSAAAMALTTDILVFTTSSRRKPSPRP